MQHREELEVLFIAMQNAAGEWCRINDRELGALESVSSSLFSFLSLNILLPTICFFFPLSCCAEKKKKR